MTVTIKLIVHREASALPYMEFRMHKSGLHVFYPEDIKNLVLMNTVEENMKAFTNRDVEGTNAARKLYAKLLYPSNVDFKRLIKTTKSKIAKCRFGILIPLKRYGERTSLP